MSKVGIKSKKKLIFSIIALFVGLMSIAVAIFAVYAANKQGSKSTFNINYQVGDNLAVKVGAKYQVENKSVVNIGEIVFNVNSDENQGYLPINEKIELSTPTNDSEVSHSYVEFTYTFENLTNTERVRVSATWESFATDVQYLNTYVDGVQFTDFATTSIASGLILEPLQTKTVVIKFEVFSTGASASMKSDSSTGLKWILNHYKETT